MNQSTVRVYIQAKFGQSIHKSVRIENRLGEILDCKVKKCLKSQLSIISTDISLEYLGSGITKPGLLKLALKRFLTLRQGNWFSLLTSMFFSEYISIPKIFYDNFPIKFHQSDTQEVWISRQACLSGIHSTNYSRNIEYDLLRKKDKTRILIWSTDHVTKAILFKPNLNSYLPAKRVLGPIALSPTSNVQFIENVQVIGHQNLIVDSKFIILSKKRPVLDSSWPNATPSYIDNCYFLPEPRTVSTTPRAFFALSSYSWFHFFIEYFPILSKVSTEVREMDCILPSGLPSQILEIYKLLGFESFIFLNEDESLHVNKLCVALDYNSTSFSDFKNEVNLRKIQSEIFDLFLPRVRNFNFSPQKIYLKRSDDLLRGISNQQDIEVILKEAGFTTLIPEENSALDQFSMLHNAKVIVGESGAALTSAIFAKPGAAVIELRPPLKNDRFFWKEYCETLGLKHSSIDCEPKFMSSFKSDFRSEFNARNLKESLSILG